MSAEFIESLSNANTILTFFLLLSLVSALIGCGISEFIQFIVDHVRGWLKKRREKNDITEKGDE